MKTIPRPVEHHICVIGHIQLDDSVTIDPLGFLPACRNAGYERKMHFIGIKNLNDITRLEPNLFGVAAFEDSWYLSDRRKHPTVNQQSVWTINAF